MANREQVAIWNDMVGGAWVDNAGTYDEMLAPFGAVTMDRLDLESGHSVLDVGCGTGATTVEIARRVAPGRVVGVDLSARMLTAARDRADRAGAAEVTFIEGDVQTVDLGHGVFDRAFSRMGVMFFADPVAAFTNIAGALGAGGRFGFCCFQGADANPGLVVPVLSVAEILELPALPDPTAPGPFSLADPGRTVGLLERAGLVEVTMEAGPDRMRLSGAAELRGLAERLLVQNPLTNAPFVAAEQSVRGAALDAAATGLAPYRDGGVVELAVGTWVVTARKPG